MIRALGNKFADLQFNEMKIVTKYSSNVNQYMNQ